MSAMFIGFSVFVWFTDFSKSKKNFRDGNSIRKILKINPRPNKRADQEFLAFLWSIKSQLSSGAIPANLTDSPPNHFLTEKFDLVLRIGSQTGTALTPLINRFIKQVKYQIELKQEIESELATTKATVLVLATLPLLGIFLSLLLGANSINWLLNSTLGRVSLGLGILLNLLGWLWVQRIVAKALVNK
jgi:hypothetical protein